jgi:phospholipase/carboxylesterase
MNRLFAAPEFPASGHTTTTRVDGAQNNGASSHGAQLDPDRVRQMARAAEPQSFFAPQHYEAGYAYPLVVWLHSTGGAERQVARVMPLVSTRNYVGVGVRGISRSASNEFTWPQSAEGIASAEQRILAAVDKAQTKFNIHSGRIFLAGYEAGGTMALRVALRNPGRFAAAVSVNGAFPEGERPLACLDNLRKFPLLVAHCRDSQTYPVDRLCQELALFHAAGLSVTLRQYPCGDELTTQMLRDLDVWLMGQVTGCSAAAEADAQELPRDRN